MIDKTAQSETGGGGGSSGPVSVADVQRRVAEAAFGNRLITNVLRGQVVEAIIAFALEPEWQWCSADYAPWDFERSDGVKLEVKQSSAKQSWESAGPSKGLFDIRMRKGRWEGQNWIDDVGRNADIYVFAWHPVTDDSADHRDPGQWEFHVVATEDLPPIQRISLTGVRRLAQPCGFAELASRVAEVSSRVGQGSKDPPLSRER